MNDQNFPLRLTWQKSYGIPLRITKLDSEGYPLPDQTLVINGQVTVTTGPHVERLHIEGAES